MKVTLDDGITLGYDNVGAGARTMLFTHGLRCDRSFMAPQVEYFSQRYRVINVDLRGTGKATDPCRITTLTCRHMTWPRCARSCASDVRCWSVIVSAASSTCGWRIYIPNSWPDWSRLTRRSRWRPRSPNSPRSWRVCKAWTTRSTAPRRA